MVASAKVFKRSRHDNRAPSWHTRFLEMLPLIERHAKIAFRHLDSEARAEAVQAAVCSACAATARLAELDKLDLCYASVMARFAVAQTKDGRMLGRSLNCRDVLSRYCQVRNRVVVERLDQYDSEQQAWKEILIPDQTCTPAELAASRIDFPAWLDTLKPRDRKIAMKLAAGETTSRVSRLHRLSPGRISQLRRELKVAWESYISEAEPPHAAGMPA